MRRGEPPTRLTPAQKLQSRVRQQHRLIESTLPLPRSKQRHRNHGQLTRRFAAKLQNSLRQKRSQRPRQPTLPFKLEQVQQRPQRALVHPKAHAARKRRSRQPTLPAHQGTPCTKTKLLRINLKPIPTTHASRQSTRLQLLETSLADHLPACRYQPGNQRPIAMPAVGWKHCRQHIRKYDPRQQPRTSQHPHGSAPLVVAGAIPACTLRPRPPGQPSRILPDRQSLQAIAESSPHTSMR